MSYKVAVLSYEARVQAFWTLIAISILSFGIYAYSINATIHNTAARQHLEAQVGHLNSELGELEFAYIERRNEIGAELASVYGLQEIKNPLYVSRTPGSALTLHTR